jgi:hypothetical protein
MPIRRLGSRNAKMSDRNHPDQNKPTSESDKAGSIPQPHLADPFAEPFSPPSGSPTGSEGHTGDTRRPEDIEKIGRDLVRNVLRDDLDAYVSREGWSWPGGVRPAAAEALIEQALNRVLDQSFDAARDWLHQGVEGMTLERKGSPPQQPSRAPQKPSVASGEERGRSQQPEDTRITLRLSPEARTAIEKIMSLGGMDSMQEAVRRAIGDELFLMTERQAGWKILLHKGRRRREVSWPQF